MTNPYRLIFNLTKVLAIVAYIAFGLFLFSTTGMDDAPLVAGGTFIAWAISGIAVGIVLDYWRKFLIQVSSNA